MFALLGVVATERGPVPDLSGPVQAAGGDDQSLKKGSLAYATSPDQGDGTGLGVTKGRNHGDLDSTALM
jgi:hypothetical protein